MSQPIAEIGLNGEIDEDETGNLVLRNTATGTEISLADLIDVVGGASIDALEGGIAGEGVTLTDLVGAGLVEDQQDLRIASQIWDSNQGELVADVNSSSVSAEQLDANRIDLSLAVDIEQSVIGGDPITIDVTGAGVFEVEMDQDATINLTGASASGIYSVTVLFEDNGFVPTWDSAIIWEDDEPPELNDDLIMVQFASRDEGTTWFGRASGVFNTA